MNVVMYNVDCYSDFYEIHYDRLSIMLGEPVCLVLVLIDYSVFSIRL
jgi:hypothetical protein